MKFLAALTSAALLALVAPHPTTAADANGGSRSVVVHFADLDLDTPKGTATLMHRLRQAAERVCARDGQGLEQWAHSRTCIKFAVANAVATVDRPTVSEYIALTSAKSPPTPMRSRGAR